MTSKEYDKEKKDLDFALLDASLFHVDVLNINENPLNEMKARCDSCLKRVESLTKALETSNQNLENVRKSGNQKAVSIIESQLQKLTEDLTRIEEVASETKNEYNLMQSDYATNSNFFKNEALINGIRNSVAHGNYEIISNPGPTIVFQDIYEGEVTFKASIALADFYNFIDTSSKIVLEFIKEKEEKRI